MALREKVFINLSNEQAAHYPEAMLTVMPDI